MTERPILFSGAMVRAILAGTKTQTRRVVKPQPRAGDDWAPYRSGIGIEWMATSERGVRGSFTLGKCPYGVPGDRLWVREAWCLHDLDVPAYRCDATPPQERFYKWHPSIHMPRWASRLTLEVVSVRVERVQEISHGDVLAEGIDTALLVNPIADFARLWDSINGERAPWESNPWVWVVEFKRAL